MKFQLFGLLALISLTNLNAQPDGGYPVSYVNNSEASDECCDYCTRFSIEGDYLCWQPRTNLTVGSLSVTTSDGVNINSITTEEQVKMEKYFPGYRVGVFYQDQCTCWKLGLIWTHIKTNAKSTFIAPAGGIALLDLVQEATAALDTKLDYLDFDIAARARILPCFLITPHIGIRGYQFTDHLNLTGIGTIPASPVNRTFDSRTTTKTWACGIEGGLWLEWNLSCGLSFLGHVGGAIMLYDTRSRTNGHLVDTDAAGTILVNSTSTSRRHRKSSLDNFNYYIGAQYAFCLCELEIALRAGWEHFTIEIEQFEYQGLTAGLTINF